jgi:hypothetical protein
MADHEVGCAVAEQQRAPFRLQPQLQGSSGNTNREISATAIHLCCDQRAGLRNGAASFDCQPAAASAASAACCLQDNPCRSLLALPIAMQHPAFGTSPQLLCKAACVCKDWRQAVQQCAARNTEVQLYKQYISAGADPTQMRTTVTSFSGHQTGSVKHGGLVKSLAIPVPCCWIGNSAMPQSIMQTAVQLLQPAMQLAAAAQSSCAEACSYQ